MEVGRRYLLPHEMILPRELPPATTTRRFPPTHRLVRHAPHHIYEGRSRMRTPRDDDFGAEPASADAIAGLPSSEAAREEDDDFGGEPASDDAIAGLLSRRATAREEGDCAVCQDGYEPGDRLTTMPCAHGFHEGCIVGWLSVSRLCRFQLPSASDQLKAEHEAHMREYR